MLNFRYTNNMLRLSSHFANQPIFSVHAGGKVGELSRYIINPDKMIIEGFYVSRGGIETGQILLVQDVREIAAQGYVINHEETLADPSELIRLKEVLAIEYELNGLKVQTESGKRLGKVEDFIVNDDGWMIQKIHVRQPTWKSMLQSALVINRTQIVEVTDKRIIVSDGVIKTGAPARAPEPIN